MNEDEARTLFKKRDEAILSHDLPLFLSTQRAEIPLSSSDGYLSLRSLKSDLLWLGVDPEVSHLWLAVVSERYVRADGSLHTGQLLYYIRKNAQNEPVIVDIGYGQSRK